MNQLGFFLLIGIGLLALLVAWVGRRWDAPAQARNLADENAFSTDTTAALPSRALAERIFALQDWEFVSRQVPSAIQRTFLQERRTLAIAWLRQTRNNAGEIMQAHRRAVRGIDGISPATELRLALDFALFLFSYELLCGLIRLRGPFFARSIVIYAATMADQLSHASQQILGGMETAELGRFKGGL